MRFPTGKIDLRPEAVIVSPVDVQLLPAGHAMGSAHAEWIRAGAEREPVGNSRKAPEFGEYFNP